jgi:DGQHR domain-containing protein
MSPSRHKHESSQFSILEVSFSGRSQRIEKMVQLSATDSRLKKLASYRALLISQNGRRFYFATVPADELFPCCFVARRDEDPQTGFQRALNETRADDIAEYLSRGTGSIPSNIVLSAQSIAQLKYSARAGSISFTPVPGSFLVLDGQHRLWGYHKCPIKHRVPVAIYSGLTRAEEAKLFIDINTTQRGVPAALLLDIKQIAEIESNKEQLLREYFDRLSRDPKSPLAGKLSAAKSLTGRISRVTFNRALASALTTGTLLNADPDFRYRLLLNYLNAFDAEIEDKRLLVRSAYFEAIMEVLDELIRSTVAIYGNAKQESLQKTVRPLARLNFASGDGGRALPTKKAVVSSLQAALRQNVPLSEDML